MVEQQAVAAFTLRPVRPDDDAALFAIYASTRADEMAMVSWGEGQREQFLLQQFLAQQAHYQAYFPTGDHRMILRDGAPVGRIYVQWGDEKIHLLDIALLPAWRGQGIGRALMRDLLEQARAAGLPITLHVYRLDEPVLAWYQRLSFEIIGGSGLYYLMEWRPLP